MLTLFIIVGLLPVVVFSELTAQRWLFKNGTEQHDLEWELYRQRYD